MTVIISISYCFLLCLVSAHFEVLSLSVRSCHCYSCRTWNQTGNCMDKTDCESIAAGIASTTGTNHAKRLVGTSDYSPTNFYSCSEDCGTVNATLINCVSNAVSPTSEYPRIRSPTSEYPRISSPTSEYSRGSVLEIICASVVPSAGAVLVLIGLLVYCQLRRMERRKKLPPKMLPKAQDLDASIRSSAIAPESQLAKNGPPLKTYIVSDATTGTLKSGVKRSQSLRRDKEDWTPPGISKSGPSSPETPRPSTVATDKTRGRPATEAQPTYTNVENTREENDDSYINVGDLVNNSDEDNSPDSPDYVNELSRNSVEYANVDVTADQMTETSKTPTQRNSLGNKQFNGSILTSSPGKAVSPDWLVSIREDISAPMDPDYIDMTVKSKQETTTPRLKKTETTPAPMFASSPDVRMMHNDLRTVYPVYENQKPRVHRKPRAATAHDLSNNL